VADLSREVLRDFLDHLEQSRSCSVRTRYYSTLFVIVSEANLLTFSVNLSK